MTPGPPDDLYLTWLYSQVKVVRTRRSSTTYWNLFRQLLATEFVWFVPNDDNRAADGRELRREWMTITGKDVDPAWLETGCSFLELLIGLSRRLAFEGGSDGPSWFWHLIVNLELLGCHDRSDFDPDQVEDSTHMVIFRTYDKNGFGGLFPLNRTDNDQRQVEIWYQLSEYLLQEF